MLSGYNREQVINEVEHEIEEEDVAAEALIGSGYGNLNADPGDDQALMRGKANAKDKQRPVQVAVLMWRIEPAEHAEQDDQKPRHARDRDTVHRNGFFPHES